MQIEKHELKEFADMIAASVVKALEVKGIVGNPSANQKTERTGKTAYQKTEALLYNYRNFKKIVEERMSEIDTIKKYGVPKKSSSIVEYGTRSNTAHGIKTVEESVYSAVFSIEKSVEHTKEVISMVDKGLEGLKKDPYFRILQYRYFEGRTQEDIAAEFNCSQVTVSKNNTRLVNELSVRLFPDQVVHEFLI